MCEPEEDEVVTMTVLVIHHMLEVWIPESPVVFANTPQDSNTILLCGLWGCHLHANTHT